MADTLNLTPSLRGFLYESFRNDIDIYIKEHYGRGSMGPTQRALMKEALNFYFRYFDPTINETKDFPKKGEPVKQYYIIHIELDIPGLSGKTMEFEKKFEKTMLDTI